MSLSLVGTGIPLVVTCYGQCYTVGLSGWGIAYYIDNTLIPVLRVRRNVTYTFIVEAGDDVNDGPNYHPFYITSSIDGGILLDTPEQRAVSIINIMYQCTMTTHVCMAYCRQPNSTTSSSSCISTSFKV